MGEDERRPQTSEVGRPSHLRLGEILIRRGAIDQDDLALALAQQDLDGRDVPLGRHLVNLGAITDETLTSALSEQSGLPVVDLEQREPDPIAAARVASDVARRLRALPIEHLDDAIVVAIAEPPTRELRREIGRQLGARPEFVLAAPGALDAAIDVAYPPRDGGWSDEQLDLVPLTGARYVPSQRALPVASAVVSDATNDRDDDAIAWILALVGDDVDATSIHVQSEPDGTRVRARVDGELRDLVVLHEPVGPLLVERVLASGGASVDLAAPHHATVACDDNPFAPALQLTAVPTVHGVSIVLRRRGATTSPAPDDVGLRQLHDVLEPLVARRRGLVVVSGGNDPHRRALLRAVAGAPHLQTKSVGAIAAGDPAGFAGATVLDGEHDAADAVRLAADLDHDLVVVEDPADDVVRAAVDLAVTHATVLVGLDAADLEGAVARVCAAVPRFLVASALECLVAVDADGRLTVLEVSDELRTALVDGGDVGALLSDELQEPRST